MEQKKTKEKVRIRLPEDAWIAKHFPIKSKEDKENPTMWKWVTEEDGSVSTE